MTLSQKSLLDFIRGYIAEHEFSPSFEEMRVGAGLASKSNVHRMVAVLVQQGFLRRMGGVARSLGLVDRGAHSAGLVGAITAAALKDHKMDDDPNEEPLLVFSEQEFRRFLIAHLGAR